MRKLLPALEAGFLIASMLALAACSPSLDAKKPEMVAESHLPTQAEVDRFLAEGPEPTLQKFRPLDYWLHYKLMQATGIEQALGGEAQAIAALQALGNAYERKLRGAEADMPKTIPAAFTGEGMASGFTGMGMGAFVGLLTGEMLAGAVRDLSDEHLARLVKAGPIKFDGKDGSAEIHFGEDGSMAQSMEFEVNENGLNGKVRMKTRMDACPDPQGKVTVDIDVDSQMSVSGKPGTGGSVHSQFKYERYLDDDAHLIDSSDGGASNLRIKMSGAENFENQSADITTGQERGGKVIFEHHDESGLSIFRPDEVERMKELLRGAELLQTLIAEAMLRGMSSSKGAPWESGRCIDLKVTSSPSKRKGIKPNTAFDLEAIPRAKADGAPAGGTVTATLSGGASLQPGSGKVKADAKYQYAGPDKKEESASIAFESRSKRGVGKATLDFDTKEGKAYRITGVGQCTESHEVCDVSKPFTYTVCGGTMTHQPSSATGGSHSFLHSGMRGSGSYTLSGSEEEMTATYQTTTCGMGQCFKTPNGKAIWTKIEACE